MELTIVLTHIGAFVAGAVFSYLFLRANPNKKSAVDKWVDENK